MMMTLTCNQTEILESENFSAESYLNREDKKIVRKMMRYINTFPLTEFEIEQLRKDIIGMAAEEEKRGGSLRVSLDKSPRDFCDELIYALGGIKAPGGRKLLRISAAYYQIMGFLLASVCLINIISLLITGTFGYLTEKMIDFSPLNDFLLLLPAAVLYYTAGRRAQAYCNNPHKSKLALRWGIFMLLFEIIWQLKDYIGFPNSIFAENDPFINPLLLILIPLSIFELIMPVVYIAGARRNRPRKEE